MLRLSLGIKISILSKSKHSTYVLSTIITCYSTYNCQKNMILRIVHNVVTLLRQVKRLG